VHAVIDVERLLASIGRVNTRSQRKEGKVPRTDSNEVKRYPSIELPLLRPPPTRPLRTVHTVLRALETAETATQARTRGAAGLAPGAGDPP
jgi:hypothetical protein